MVDALGNKCLIQMIGQSKKFRALNDIITYDHFGIRYYDNKKSWMRTDIFYLIIQHFVWYTMFKLKRNHEVLLMHNFSGHKCENDWKNVEFDG